MNAQEIENILLTSLELNKLYVVGENGHFKVVAIGDIFANLSRIKQQQIIYQPLTSYIANNQIHALTIQTYTIEQWQEAQLFNSPNLL